MDVEVNEYKINSSYALGVDWMWICLGVRISHSVHYYKWLKF